MKIQELSEKILHETEKIIVGKSDRTKLLIMAVLADGHVLLDDLPGVGKTTLIKTFAKAVGCGFRRVQFVPDLLPSDIIGMRIFNQKSGEFELREGPVMTNILLADEINRAIPRTQSALLEAMEERQVTIDGIASTIPEPFMVLATQNPVESESTFRLPAAQMDRFMLRISMGYPDAREEVEMLGNLGDSIPFESVNAVTSGEEIIAARREIAGVFVSEAVAEYIVAIANRSREHKTLRVGLSPRATRSMYKASKVWAAMQGRSFVTPDDVKALVHPVFDHRVLVDPAKKLGGVTAASVLDEILQSIDPMPTAEEGAERL